MHQPRALRYLFSTELWERFGFYIVQGLLIFYLTKVLGFSDSKGYHLLGDYTAYAYIAPVLGGWFADRILGYRYAILIGALLLFLGYSTIATLNYELLFVGLTLLILGTGFLKPNISSFLGDFYSLNDPRRDSGFTIFYIGINIGVILSTLSSGFVQEHLGWSLTFATAAFGIIIAVISFGLGYKYYDHHGNSISHAKIHDKTTLFFANKWATGGTILVAILTVYLLFRFASMGMFLMIALGIATFIYLIYLATRLPILDRKKMRALIVLLLFSVVYWGLFFQIFFSINLFISRNVDRHLFGIEMPPIAFVSLESLFIVTLGPLFARMWKRVNQRPLPPSSAIKFTTAFFMMTIAMGVLSLATHIQSHALINPLWIVLAYLFITLSELLLSPIGLAMITELAPQKYVGLIMGVWFMAVGFGGLIAGHFAQWAAVPTAIKSLAAMNVIYGHAFWYFTLIALAVGITLAISTRWVKKLERAR